MVGSGIACDQCDFDHDINIIFLTSNDQIDIVSVITMTHHTVGSLTIIINNILTIEIIDMIIMMW